MTHFTPAARVRTTFVATWAPSAQARQGAEVARLNAFYARKAAQRDLVAQTTPAPASGELLAALVALVAEDPGVD